MTTAPIADMAAAAERNVIASCLVDAAAVERCHATGLTAADFWILRARYTYGAIRAVAGTLGADGVNRVTVGYELAQRPADDGTQRTQIEVVTLAWLSQLEDDLVTSVGAEWYAGIVREQAQRRRLEAATEQVARLAASGDPDAARKASALMAGVAGPQGGDSVPPSPQQRGDKPRGGVPI